MKLPNWFRIAWWAGVLGLVTWLLSKRYDDFVAGRSSPTDVFLFVVWIALLLAPVFQEVSLFGISLKQKFDELKTELAGLRADIQNSVAVTTSISPTIQLPTPPPDTQLPALEERMTRVLEGVLQSYGIRPSEVQPEGAQVPDDALYLFTVRYSIERELRRIWDKRMEAERFPRPLSAVQIASSLVNEGFIDPGILNVLREVYSVASPAIHGVQVTKPQVQFVRDVAPRLLAALRAVA